MGIDKSINFNHAEKLQYILSFFISLIPISMVIGAAIMEFFIISTCLLFFYLNFKKIGIDYYKNSFFLIFITFCIFLIFSSITSENIFNSLRNTLFYFRFGILILAIWYLLDNFEKFKIIFFYSALITYGIIIIYTILQVLFFQEQIIYDNRIVGLFGDELVQGSFLLRMTPVFVVFYLYNKNSLNKNFVFFYNAILISVFFLIIISGERTAIFLTFMAIFLTFFFIKLSLKKISIIILLALAIVTLAFHLFPKVKERVVDRTLNEFFYKSDSSKKLINKKISLFSEGHQDHIESGILIFKNHFIKGVGVRNYRVECKKDIYKKVGKYYCTTHPHNTFIQILSETGIIGFIFFVICLGFVYLKLYINFKDIYLKNREINTKVIILLVIIVVNFFPLVPSGSFFNNWLSTLYFFPIGLILYELNYKKFLSR
jgi:O-antigen ligase